MKPSTHSPPRAREQPGTPEPRREIVGLPVAVHGGLDFAELQALALRPEDVLDFSANINPYGPSPTIREAMTTVPLDRYPDRNCLELCMALAESLDVTPEQILPGNGAAELIWLVALAFVRPSSRVLVLGPTFCEYARVAELMGGRVATFQAREDTDFVPQLGKVAADLKSLRPRLVFLCNPNNPTGAILPSAAIARWARQQPETLFVVDEAYLPFADGSTSVLALAQDNVLVLRSMTKDFGLAGLRLGYAVGATRLITLLRRVQPPWSVNALAQVAGVAALRDLAHCQRGLERVAQAKRQLVMGLTRLGLRPFPSATHFALVPVGDGSAMRQTLLRRGLLVRDCASFGLPACIRISTRRPEENQRLLAALGKEL
jgi:L-threonine-O-3-phosphate decarboxylase